VATDSSGNVYVADYSDHRIRKLTPNEEKTSYAVSTIAGPTSTECTLGSNNDACPSGFTDATGSAARFQNPCGVAVDSEGNVYVAEYGNHRIRKITPQGVVTTLAGSTQGFQDGTGTSAQFSNPYGLAIDSSGNLYVADSFNNRIRKMTPQGVVTTLAGSGTAGHRDGPGIEPDPDPDTDTGARFQNPCGVAVDSEGNVYVAEYGNHRIRKMTPQGVVTTLAGSTQGFQDGTGTSAQFNNPYGVAIDSSGNLYVADSFNNRIRKITSAGVVTTLAGSGTAGHNDGTGTSAQFSNPYGVTVDAAGNLYVADSFNNRIRKIEYK